MERLNVRREVLGVSLALAAAAAVGSLALDAGRRPRTVLVALEAEEAAELSTREGLALPDFLERARAMGVGAVVLRDKPIEFFRGRGEVLRFSAEEVEKWKAAGLIAPGLSLRPGTLWLRDKELLSRMLDAAARRGLAVSTAAAGGYLMAELPLSPEAPLWIAPDPGIAKALSGLPLTILRSAGPAMPDSFGLRWGADGRVEGTAEASAPRDLTLAVRSVPVGAPRASWLRAANGHPRRLIIAGLSAEAGVEANFERLRSALRAIAEAGALGLPARAPSAPDPASPWKASAARLALWLLGVLGPLFAARAGLLALKRTRTAVLIHWPVTSPVLQLAVGMGAAAAAAAGMGLATRAALELTPVTASAVWVLSTMGGPVLIGLLTLYTIDLDDWAEALKKPVTYAGALQLLGVALAALLLLSPRAAWAALGGGAAPPSIALLPEGLWWLPWRWREVFVGYPCLLHALFLVNARMDSPDAAESGRGAWSDPRGWFLLGLLAPAGAVASLGRGLWPADLALAQTVQAAALGSALGGLLIAARLWDSGPKDLETNRTIVPERKV